MGDSDSLRDALLPAERATQAVLHVRPEALARVDEVDCVYVVEPLDTPNRATVQRRTVTRGETTSEGVQILSGLTHGERVITAGLSQLTVGQVVRLDLPAPATAAAGAAP